MTQIRHTVYPKGLLNRAGKNPGPIAWAKKKYCSWAHENGNWWSGVQVKLASAVDLLVIISLEPKSISKLNNVHAKIFYLIVFF